MTASSWTSLDPWEKAARWQKVSPEVAAAMLELAKDHAKQRMVLDRLAEEHRMDLERAAERHRIEQEKLLQAHRTKMDTRLWYTQFAGLIINAVSLTVLAVIVARLGREAVVPALTVLGAGGGLTAGSLVISNTIRRHWQQAIKQPPAAPAATLDPQSLGLRGAVPESTAS